MEPIPIHYCFSQAFSVPAIAAYNWSIDFTPADLSLMKMRGKRQVKKISDDTIILTDTTNKDGKQVEKRKLVKVDATRLSWSNTHLSGPHKYSQFLYQITPEEAGASRLSFTGLQLNYGESKITPEAVAALEREVKQQDSAAWKLLAREMEKEILGDWFSFSTRKTLEAHMNEVFNWCTDYQDTDAELAHMIEHTHKEADPTTQRMKVLDRSGGRVRYVTYWDDRGEVVKQYTTVHLHPPDHWIAVGTGDRWDSQGLFRLTPNRGSTTIDVTIFNRYKDRGKPNTKKMAEFLSSHWDDILREFNKRHQGK